MSQKTTGKDHTKDPATEQDEDDALDHLAQRFLDLWREQVAATADGTQAASAIGRLYASLGADTSRMGEGFEAWGNLIGQMAMGQQPGMTPSDMAANMMKNPLMDGLDASNPLKSMMDQMAKAARDLPTAPFPGVMPFGTNPASTTAKPNAAAPNHEPHKPAADKPKTTTQDAPSTGAVKADNPNAVSTTKTSSSKSGGQKPAKGQETDEQSTNAKAKSPQKNPPKTGRAKAASDAHGSRDDELAQLARRIADLSETIAALEGRTSGSGGGTPDGDE